MLPRGIRNNNPLNIRRTAKDQWQGLRAQQTDASFCQFESLDYGWRAAFYLLTRTYYHKYRLFTIRAIISKWAPPQENLTSTYIANVSRCDAARVDNGKAGHVNQKTKVRAITLTFVHHMAPRARRWSLCLRPRR